MHLHQSGSSTFNDSNLLSGWVAYVRAFTVIQLPTNRTKQNPAYRKKRIQLQEETDEVMQLSKYQNPVKGDVEGVTAIFRLFEVAIALAEKPSVFRDEYLKPFLNAWKAQIKVKEEPGMGLVIREDDKVYIQLGKGTGKRILSCPKDLEKLILETFMQYAS